ncbi:MAG: hypothetical protein AB7U73_07055 [Pirellulales bacterium]
MSQIRIFELIEALEAGRSAQARLLIWDAATESYVPGRKTITLYDFVGGHGGPGDRGYCFQNGASQLWEALCGIEAQHYRPFG